MSRPSDAAPIGPQSRPFEMKSECVSRSRRSIVRHLLIAFSLLLMAPTPASAGPKEDAFQVVEQFKSAFDATDVPAIVKLFAQDTNFLGTVSPKLITKAEDIDAYFQGIKTDTPRKITLEDFSTFVLSELPFSLPASIRSQERRTGRQ